MNIISTLPKKLTKTYNKPNLSAGYDVTFTNDPQYGNNGASTQEVIELDVDNKNIVTISDKYNFIFNQRNTNFTGAYGLIANAYNTSNTTANNYYIATSDFYEPTWPLNNIKYDMTWPYRKNTASLTMEYSNNPRFNVTINGSLFKNFDFTIENTIPQDIIQEYKIINRPNKLSLLNYAYQTEKGQVAINFTTNIGRQTNEFFSGFRNDIGSYLYSLYQYSISLFMNQFNDVVPINFTYFLSDVKYTFNNDGSLSMNIQYTYAIKKYIM